MGIFDMLFGKAIQDGVAEGVKEGVNEGLTSAFASEEVQLSFDKMMQSGYDLGRSDEKNNKPWRKFTQERHAKKGKR